MQIMQRENAPKTVAQSQRLRQHGSTAMDTTAIIIAMTDSEEPFALEAIRSVLNQSTRPEVIRVYVEHDNAWIEGLLPALGGVEVCRTDLAPPGTIRNVGAAQATTTWVAYLDGDDLWEPRKQEAQIAAARQGAGLVGCDYYLTDGNGQARVAAICRHIPSASTWFAKRELMLEHPFNPQWGRHEDSSWWEHNRAWTFTARVPQALSAYRIRQNSRSNDTPGKRRKLQVLDWADKPAVGPLVKAGAWLAHATYRATTYPAPAAFR